MHRKFDVRRYLTAFFVGIFAVVGTLVAIDTPARAANDLGYNATVDSTLVLNGSNQYAKTTATVIPATGNFTVETWINETSGTTADGDIIGQGAAGNAENRFLIRLAGSGSGRHIVLFPKGTSGQNLAQHIDFPPVLAGQWNHIAVTYTSGTNYKIYLNGRLIYTYASVVTVDQSGAFWVGRNYHSDNTYFNGSLDEVKVWNTVRTADEIVSDMHSYGSANSTTFSSALVAYYDMNEGSGTTIFNRTATAGLNLTTTNSPGFSDVKTTTKLNGKSVVQFPRTYLTPSGGWTVPAGVSKATLLAVAGGGSGGTRHAGGGGAGSLQYESAWPLTPGAVMTVQVGQGGLGQPGGANRPDATSTLGGVNGQKTKVGSLELLGGGAGAGGNNPATAGGSSGGMNVPGTVTAVGAGSGLKNTGAQGLYINSSTGLAGGGGGGAGSIGYQGTNSAGGTGGDGVEYSITGTPICYAAGGGGGVGDATAAGGAGGDGCANAAATGGAGSSKAAALSATPNTGSGGGGGGYNQVSPYTDQNSGSGGSGIVVLAYAPVDDNFMSFNGTSQYARATGSQVIPASGAFTVEAWIKPVTDAALSAAVIVSQGTSTNNRFYFKRSNNGDLIVLRDAGLEITCANIPSDIWVHVAVALDGTNMTCFVNGSQVKQVSYTASSSIGTGFYVGQYATAPSSSNTYWKGGIDQVKIWNVAITDASVIARSMNMHAATDATSTVAGLTNLFDFNESGSTTTVEDKIGSTDLTTVNSPSRSSVVTTEGSGASKRYTFNRTFLSSWGGWFYPDGTKAATALVVGAGGGAGKPGNPQALTGGGGGAGAVYPISKITFPTSAVPIVVGVGGRGSSVSTGKGTTGGNSQLGTLVVGGGSGGNSFEYVGPRGAAPGGSGFVAGGNGGGGRQEVGTSTAGYALGDTAGSASSQTFNGLSFTALAGVAGSNDDTDSGSGGLGGQSLARSSVISGATVEYGKRSSYVHWGHTSQPTATPGSGGSLNYSYAGQVTTNTSNNGGDGFAGLIVIAAAAPVLYYNFSDRNSTHDATTAVANLGTNSAYTATKVNTPTHNYVDGTLNVTGTTYANGSYVDVADISSSQFSSGITVDFEVDFGSTAETWERVLDFGVSGSTTSNILVSRRGVTSDIVFEIYNGTTSQGHCYVLGGIPSSAQMNRWTFSLDGTNCYVWKNGVAQTTTTTSVSSSYTEVQRSAFPYLPASNVTWAANFIGKSNWTADAAAKLALRSLRIYSGAFTFDDVGDISYRTVNFDANFSGSTAPSSRYTSGKTTLQSAPVRTGYTFNGWYDNATAASGALVGAASAEYTPSSTPITFYADWVSDMPSVNVQFDELNFDYANVVQVVGTNGKNLNDKVLFLNVTTKGGVQVDALVTTQTLSSATIANYESGTGAGGANSYFQADVDIAAANGYAEFKFDFYQHGVSGASGNPCTSSNTSCTGATKVKLQNVNVSAIDIDFNQWNDFTAAESYTVAGNSYTKLKECLITVANASVGGTCTARAAPSSFPANMRFQGSADTARTNDPVDMAIVTYAEIETFRIKFGRSASGKPNYYGVAFKALSWGAHTPATTGGTSYTITYNGNSATVGNVPTSNTGVVGANITLPGANTLTKTGYTFAGWNTAADGTGTNYAAGNVIPMPLGGMTLYAKWTANQYMLIYKLYAGTSGPATEMRYTGATANLSSVVPVMSGYVFDHWDTAADGSGTDYAPGASFTMPGANTTLHAMYTTATGTIAYNANNGSNAPSSSNGTSGTTVAAAGAGSMTRSNYTFSGWNTAANGSGTDYSAGANVAYPGNGLTTTLYAQWTPILYSYSYNANGGTGAPSGGSTTAGSTVTIPSSTTTRTGYTFDGWTTSADGSGTVYTNGGANPSLTMPGANTVLYAKWSAITYTLAFNSNDAGAGANPTSATGTYGANLAAAAAPTAPTGKKFNGWNTAADGSGATYAAGGNYQITANGTLYAQWVADTVNLFYSANGGSGAPTSTTASANSNTTLSGTSPSRTGFTFSGWTTTANGSGTVYGVSSTFPVPGSDTTLYAKWTPIGYNFIYNANGGSGAPSTVSYFMGEFVVIDNSGTTVRTGYTFAGWNTLADGTGSDYVGGQNFLMSNSNMTMYAKWTSNPYTLTYNGNLGSGSPTAETRNAGSTANLSATVPTRTGYSFNGWNTAQNGSGSSYNSSASYTMPTTNSTLYAQWTANSNAVAYNANNGSGAPSGGTFSFGSTVTVSNTAPTRTGYTFLGWNTAADGTGTNYSAADTFAMPNSSVTLYARWSILQKSVTYDANGGAGVDATASYNYGATVTVSTAQVSRSGYSFIGWNTMADGSGTSNAAGTTFTMPANDVTFYAIWSINAYTVYYNMNGGTGSVTPQPGNFGSSVTVSSTVPTRVGYTFSGWNTLTDGSGTDYIGSGILTIPSSNVTLYAKWTPIMYSVSFNANGGSGSPSDVNSLTAGTSTTLSVTTPNRTGYVFNGWNTAIDGSGQTYAGGQNFVVPAANTLLYAQWVANTYEIIYNANGGANAPTPANGSTNSTVSLTSGSVTRAGYTHLGWSTNSGATTATYYGPSNLSFVVPAGNTILYAVWALADITVTYNINNGSGSTPSAVTDKYLETISLAPSSAFSRSGYTFNGWNTAADGSGSSYAAEANFVMPNADKTLYAQWSAVYYAVEYSANGGSNAPANQFAVPGATVAVPTTEPVKSGYEFNDWTQVAAGTTVTPGATLTMPSSNVVLVANWVVSAASVPSGSPSTNNPSPSPSPSASPAKKKLTQTVYFKGDSAVLQTKAKQQLKALATKAVTYGYALKIQVVGRVKETPDKSYDMRLSRQRAQNVANYLKTLKVQGKWVVTAAGISPENKAISRRVDISIIW